MDYLIPCIGTIHKLLGEEKIHRGTLRFLHQNQFQISKDLNDKCQGAHKRGIDRDRRSEQSCMNVGPWPKIEEQAGVSWADGRSFPVEKAPVGERAGRVSGRSPGSRGAMLS